MVSSLACSSEPKPSPLSQVPQAKSLESLSCVPYIMCSSVSLCCTPLLCCGVTQIVCSFLVRDMGLDWRMGAEWFESILLDYDPCSNYGNWTYGAGTR